LVHGFDPPPSQDVLADVALHPVVILLLVGFLGMAVPLIEELAKTASVWPLLRRKISGAEAFLGGALGGIGFALAEALFLAQPSAAWAVTGIARALATPTPSPAPRISRWASNPSWSTVTDTSPRDSWSVACPWNTGWRSAG
jgi:hypothetical protein